MFGQHALFGMTARSQPSADHPNLRWHDMHLHARIAGSTMTWT